MTSRLKIVILEYMKRFALLTLTLWFGFNFLLALLITISISFFHLNAPALLVYFNQTHIEAADPQMINMVNTMAVLLNAVITSYCGVVLVIIWEKSFLKASMFFWPVIVSASCIQIFGFISDSLMGHKNLGANLASSLILFLGIAASLSTRLKPTKPKKNN